MIHSFASCWMNICRSAYTINMGYFNAFLRMFFSSNTKKQSLPDYKKDLKEYVDYDLNDTIIKVFECGLNSRHIPYNPKEGWDGSDLDKVLSNCLRKLNVTQGDSYYKGIFYRIFLFGYYYSWNEIKD